MLDGNRDTRTSAEVYADFADAIHQAVSASPPLTPPPASGSRDADALAFTPPAEPAAIFSKAASEVSPAEVEAGITLDLTPDKLATAAGGLKLSTAGRSLFTEAL